MEEKWYDWAYSPIRRKVDSSMRQNFFPRCPLFWNGPEVISVNRLWTDCWT